MKVLLLALALFGGFVTVAAPLAQACPLHHNYKGS